MIFTLTDRDYNPLDAYETTDYLIGVYTGYIIKSLEMSVLTDSSNPDLWAEGNYIFCKDKEGHKYWFTIYKAEDSLNGSKRELQCYSGTLDIVNEDADPIKYPSQAMPFTYYFNLIFGSDTGIVIGINEIGDLKRSLEFTSENATDVEMLQYVLAGFDNAEADLVVELEGTVPTSIKLNIFKRIGKTNPQDILTDDNDSLVSLDRTGSVEDLATALKPYGTDPNGKELTLLGKYYEEKDPDTGEILYISEKDSVHIKSRKAKKNYFVNLENKLGGDNGYIVRRYSSQAKTQDALWTAGLKQLKDIDHPAFKYEVKGTTNAKIGDTVQILSKKMRPQLFLEARLMELKFNDDIPGVNEYTFGNYKTLESELDTMAKWIEEIKKQVVTIVPPVEILYAASDQGETPPTTGWITTIPIVNPGMWLWTQVITTFSNGDVSTTYTMSRQGEDGKEGEQGEQGDPGKDGIDGKDPILHFAWANSEDGKKDFSTTVSKDKEYIGTYTDYSTVTPTDPSVYAWTRTKGDPGLTPHLHIAYANSEDGTKDFSTDNSYNRTYMGQYNDYVPEDSQDPAKYKWVKWKGDPGVDAEQVVAGYLTNQAVVLAANAGGVVTDYTTGKGTFKVTSGNVPVTAGVKFALLQQAGVKVTINATTGDYQVTEASVDNGSAILTATYNNVTIQGILVVSKARQGAQGAAGTPGPAGSDGKPTYIHIAYANSADGNTGFSLTDSARDYVGQYVDNNVAGSSDPAKYKWSKIKGAAGNQGTPGAAGANGKTSYLHTAWANSGDGKTGFSTNDPTNKLFLGSYSDFTEADSQDPAKYKWSKIKGDNAFVHTAWAWSADGTDRFTKVYPKENMVIGTKDFSKGLNTGGTIEEEKFNGNAIAKLVINTRYLDLYSIKYPKPMIAGTTYMAEFWARADKDNTPMQCFIYSPNGVVSGETSQGRTSTAIDGAIPLILSSKLERYWVKWTLADDSAAKTILLGRVGNGVTLYMSSVTIHEGGISQPWTPSPSEDYDAAYPLYQGTYSDSVEAGSDNPADYVWQRIVGTDGATGPQGPQGVTGPKGADGVQYYSWLKYADTPTSGMSDTPTNKKYMGLAYNKTTPTESTNYADYTWSLIQGPQGNQGVQGPAGANGQPTYTWIKYGTSASGAGMSDSPAGKTYIGLAYNKTTQTESTNPADYAWSLIQGPKGDTGATGATGQPGKDGAAGPPTGITESPTVPTSPYAGMLWKATANVGNYTNGTIYRWSGSAWVPFLITAVNIVTDSLSAITANLGNITSGDIKGANISGSKFSNDYSNIAITDDTITGSTQIEQGYVRSRFKYNTAGDWGQYQAGPSSTSLLRYQADGFVTNQSLDEVGRLRKMNISKRPDSDLWQRQVVEINSDSYGGEGFSLITRVSPDKTNPSGDVESSVGISSNAITMKSKTLGMGTLWANDFYKISTVGRKIVDRMPGGTFLGASDSIPITKAGDRLFEQLNGWVIEWQGYLNNKPSNGDYTYSYIPKIHYTQHEGLVMSVWVVGYGGASFRKILYVEGDRITGHDNNTKAPANTAVLTAVYTY